MYKAFIFTIALGFQLASIGQTLESLENPQDSLLKYQLEEIHIQDQTLRLLLPEVETKFGKSSEELDYIWSLIHFQDSIVLAEVLDIIELFGWIGKNRVGEKANLTIWLVIQHAPLEIQEKHLPDLKASVMKEESDGWCLAYLEDRILMRKGEEQIYGTQTLYNQETGKFHIYPIKDAENVNSRRSEIGLESIEEYAEQNGYILDKK